MQYGAGFTSLSRLLRPCVSIPTCWPGYGLRGKATSRASTPSFGVKCCLRSSDDPGYITSPATAQSAPFPASVGVPPHGGSGEGEMTNRPSEDDLIARFFAPIAGPEGLGLRDDAAVLTPPAGMDLVLTKDALVAGVHFFAEDPPAAIARK